MIETIKNILDSKFEIELLESSIQNLQDRSNRLRYNNFAYSIRELSRHFLHRLAPEENVSACKWFKIETDNGKPTRTQRIKYSIQGGITDKTLDELDFDSSELNDNIKSLKETITSLNKYTHINEDSFGLQDDEIDEMSSKVLKEFKLFAEQIISYRKELRTFLDGKIDEHIMQGVIFNYYENVDMLAPHHSLNYSEISDYHISEINQNSIVVQVHGNVHFTLMYGSRQERKEGDGLDLDQTFPFETRISYEINNKFPSEKYEIENFDVDTDEWYGDDEIDRIVDEAEREEKDKKNS